ncbi:hypothetical protein [Streptomyces griseus]|uniref:hypothetical protein n=1 Tax=Streptomyces griseus TaxID=1911 RepID=UPI0036B4C511
MTVGMQDQASVPVPPPQDEAVRVRGHQPQPGDAREDRHATGRGLQKGDHHGEKEREEQRVGPQIEMEAGLAQTQPARTGIHDPVSLGLRPHAQELLLKSLLSQAPSPPWQANHVDMRRG